MNKEHILSIDIGSVNFGYARWTASSGFYDFGVLNIKHTKDDMPTRMYRLWQKGFFKNASLILVERQMRAKFKEAVVAIRCLGDHFPKTKIIAPQSVKRHFMTSTASHRQNKLAHTVLARSFLDENEVKRLLSFKKKDDICDAIVQAMYFIQKNQFK